MELKELLSNLCYYDKRNPDACGDAAEAKPGCCLCDNCWSGRTRIAQVALTATELLQSYEETKTNAKDNPDSDQ